MNVPRHKSDQALTVALPPRPHALLIAILGLATAAAALAGTIVATLPLDPALTPVLLLDVLNCLCLVYIALQHAVGGKLLVDHHGFTITRLVSGRHWPWKQVRAVDVGPATGTFGDSPFCDHTDRIGVMIRLHGTAAGDEPELADDVVVTAGDAHCASRLMHLVEKIEALRSARPATAIRPVRVRQANQRSEFRSRSTPAAAPRG